MAVTSLNGDVYTLNQDNNLELTYSTGGQPSAIVFDMEGSSFVADLAHQAILSATMIDGHLDISQMVKDYEGLPLKGPSALLMTPTSLFFTDSGPLGETSLDNPKASLFAIDLEVNLLKPVIYNCLAGAHGLAHWAGSAGVGGVGAGNMIFVSETYSNRVLRVAQHSSGAYHTSTFYQFAGRLGPTAMAVHEDGILFVARPDFPELSKDGVISAINIETGQHEYDLTLPNTPEITGISFSKSHKDLLYVTEATTNSVLKVSLEQ